MGEAQGLVGSQGKWLTLPGVSGAKEDETRKMGEAHPSKEQGIKSFPGKRHRPSKGLGVTVCTERLSACMVAQ